VRGMPPEGRVLLVSCARVLGRGGNVKAHRICRPAEEGEQLFSVTNLWDMEGGADEESLEAAFARVRRKLSGEGSLVTREDYERAVLATPGLRVESCRAMAGRQAGGRASGMAGAGIAERAGGEAAGWAGADEEQAVRIVVRPCSLKKAPRPTAAFLQNIRKNLEERRLLGVRIILLSAVYVRLCLYLEVSVYPHYQRAQEMVETAARAYLERFCHEFGGCVSYGGLYGYLDRLDCVAGIRSLVLDARGGVKRGAGGDLQFLDNAIADELEISCSCSPEG